MVHPMQALGNFMRCSTVLRLGQRKQSAASHPALTVN
jgi:hypothetical protein